MGVQKADPTSHGRVVAPLVLGHTAIGPACKILVFMWSFRGLPNYSFPGSTSIAHLELIRLINGETWDGVVWRGAVGEP